MHGGDLNIHCIPKGTARLQSTAIFPETKSVVY